LRKIGINAQTQSVDRSLHHVFSRENNPMKRHMVAGFALTALIMSFRSSEAWAQAQEVTIDTTSEATGPSMEMVGSGIGTFAVSYLPAVVVGVTSGLDADRTLLVPLAGPWMDLTQRPKCGPVVSCNAEDTAKVLLITDGIFQAIGALTIVGGFLTTVHETKTVRAADLRPKLHVGTGSVGGKGYGLLAIGTF
jgi:hypothetical protein